MLTFPFERKKKKMRILIIYEETTSRFFGTSPMMATSNTCEWSPCGLLARQVYGPASAEVTERISSTARTSPLPSLSFTVALEDARK